MAIKYNKYQKDLKETYKNRYKDIEENPVPDRNGPVPFATRRCQRALIAMNVPCRPVFSRSGNLLPDPHRGPKPLGLKGPRSDSVMGRRTQRSTRLQIDCLLLTINCKHEKTRRSNRIGVGTIGGDIELRRLGIVTLQ